MGKIYHDTMTHAKHGGVGRLVIVVISGHFCLISTFHYRILIKAVKGLGSSIDLDRVYVAVKVVWVLSSSKLTSGS